MNKSRFSKFEYATFCLIGIVILFFTYFPYLSTKGSEEKGSISGYFLCGLGEGLTDDAVAKLAQISILFVCFFIALAVAITLILLFTKLEKESNINFVATITIGVLLSLSMIFSICAFASVLSLAKKTGTMQADWAVYLNFVLSLSMNILFWTFLIIDINEKSKSLKLKRNEDNLKIKLQELNAMKEEKLITEEEYDSLKKSYLSKSIGKIDD